MSLPDDEIPTTTVTALDPTVPIEEAIETRFRDLMNLAVTAKDLTAALTAATRWMEVRAELRRTEDAKGFGSALMKGER